VSLIDEFIARYTKELDFYSHVARIAHQRLEASLQAAGVRSIVTARAKSITRLEDKCRQRNAKREGGYVTVDEIYEDIVDLAGVRVALYFPAESDQVDGMITRLFHVLEMKKFPELKKSQEGKRFSGYSATHYRVRLKEDDLAEAQKRYATARIEIQVASVLMHAWSEVEHDLAYKPMAGDLSADEYAILDQLNGLVLTGEIALERLQKAGEARVGKRDRRITNHYDLAVHLLGAAEEVTDKPVGESGLGRVDLLYDFIAELGMDTPGSLEPYINALHGNFELRPLSEQVIDALLAEDSERYKIYDSVRARRPWTSIPDNSDNEVYQHIGMFMARWIELEALLRDLLPSGPRNGPVIPTTSQLAEAHLLRDDSLRDYDSLRRLRNLLVHGVEFPALEDLAEATRRLDRVLAEIRETKRDLSDGASHWDRPVRSRPVRESRPPGYAHRRRESRSRGAA
jgi:ppGpp synthetase/RelA/SpoT-type nucleotidyltranferase